MTMRTLFNAPVTSPLSEVDTSNVAELYVELTRPSALTQPAAVQVCILKYIANECHLCLLNIMQVTKFLSCRARLCMTLWQCEFVMRSCGMALLLKCDSTVRP